jgi:F-type H+-transporting ATPase subunit c
LALRRIPSTNTKKRIRRRIDTNCFREYNFKDKLYSKLRRNSAMGEFGMAHLAAGIGAGIVALGAGFGIGKIASAAMEAIGRQPEAAADVRGSMIIAAALIEGVALFGEVICVLLAIK